MEGYDADENHFSEEGIEANTEALLKKLGGTPSPDTPEEDTLEEKAQNQNSLAESATENRSSEGSSATTSKQPPSSSTVYEEPVAYEGRYALLVTLLTSLGAVAGALFSSCASG